MHAENMNLSRAREGKEMAHDPAALRVAAEMDVFENEREILLMGDFPGVPVEGLDIRVDGTELSIAGRRDAAPEGPFGSIELHRAFRVPRTVDPNGITAELRDGVLTLRLAKREEVRPRRIEVKAS